MGKLTKEEINQRLARVKGLEYELERLPDVNGEMNWSIIPKHSSIVMVHWDYNKIKKYISDMEIGETKLIYA